MLSGGMEQRLLVAGYYLFARTSATYFNREWILTMRVVAKFENREHRAHSDHSTTGAELLVHRRPRAQVVVRFQLGRIPNVGLEPRFLGGGPDAAVRSREPIKQHVVPFPEAAVARARRSVKFPSCVVLSMS